MRDAFGGLSLIEQLIIELSSPELAAIKTQQLENSISELQAKVNERHLVPPEVKKLSKGIAFLQRKQTIVDMRDNILEKKFKELQGAMRKLKNLDSMVDKWTSTNNLFYSYIGKANKISNSAEHILRTAQHDANRYDLYW